jgi:hypothetical protein
VHLILEFLTQTNGSAVLAESRITEMSSATWSIYGRDEIESEISHCVTLKTFLNFSVPPNSQQEIKELQCHWLGKQLSRLLGILGKKKK